MKPITTRDEAIYAVASVIMQDPNFASAKAGLDFLLGEIRDLELERNKHELDAVHWKEKFEEQLDYQRDQAIERDLARGDD